MLLWGIKSFVIWCVVIVPDFTCSFQGSTSAGTDRVVCCRLWDRWRACVNVTVYRVHARPKHAGSDSNPSRRPERYLRAVTIRWDTQLSRSVAAVVVSKTLHITSIMLTELKSLYMPWRHMEY